SRDWNPAERRPRARAPAQRVADANLVSPAAPEDREGAADVHHRASADPHHGAVDGLQDAAVAHAEEVAADPQQAAAGDPKRVVAGHDDGAGGVPAVRAQADA